MDVGKGNVEQLKTQSEPKKRKFKAPNTTVKKIKPLSKNTNLENKILTGNNRKNPINLKKVKDARRSKIKITSGKKILKENQQLGNKRKRENSAQREDTRMSQSKQFHFEKLLTKDEEPEASGIPGHVRKILDETFFHDERYESIQNIDNDKTTPIEGEGFSTLEKILPLHPEDELRNNFNTKDNITNELSCKKTRFSALGKYETTNNLKNRHLNENGFTEDSREEDTNFDNKHENLRPIPEEKEHSQIEKEDIAHAAFPSSTINNLPSLRSDSGVSNINDEIEKSRNIINYLKETGSIAQCTSIETTDIPISKKNCMELSTERKENLFEQAKTDVWVCSNMEGSDKAVVLKTYTAVDKNTKGNGIQEKENNISLTKPTKENDNVGENKIEPNENYQSNRAHFKRSWRPPRSESSTKDIEHVKDINLKSKKEKLTIFHMSALDYEAAFQKDRNEVQVKNDTSEYIDDQTDTNRNDSHSKETEKSLNGGSLMVKDASDIENTLKKNELDVIENIKFPQYDGCTQCNEKVRLIEENEDNNKVMSFENTDDNIMNGKGTANENGLKAIEKIKVSQLDGCSDLCSKIRIKLQKKEEIHEELYSETTERDIKNEKSTQNKNDLDTIEKMTFSKLDGHIELCNELKENGDIPKALGFETTANDLTSEKCTQNENDLNGNEKIKCSQFDGPTDLYEETIKLKEKGDIPKALGFENTEDSFKKEKCTLKENLAIIEKIKSSQFDGSIELNEKITTLEKNNGENLQALNFKNDANVLKNGKCTSEPSEIEESVQNKCEASNNALDCSAKCDISSSQDEKPNGNGYVQKQSTSVNSTNNLELEENTNVSEAKAEFRSSESFLITAQDFFSRESHSSGKSSSPATNSSPNVNEEVEKNIILSDQEYCFDLDDDFSLTASQLNMLEKNENYQMKSLSQVKNTSQQTEYCDNTHFGFDSITVEVIEQLCYLRQSVESIKELLQTHLKECNTEK